MKNAVKRISKIALTLIFILTLLLGAVYQLMPPTSGSERYFSGAAEEYCNSLIELGFPSDYAIALTELHMLHPNWSFRPLDVTGLKSTYTWEYVIEQETKHPETNLVSASSAYSAYHHPLNHEKYDSGYYQASVDAVEYFMDPRNFLNEADIFLFFDLAVASDTSIEAIEAVLSDTFMEKELLDNGMSYAAYFQKIGTELGISPVYLAAKARQEQGVKGSSPLISGACGTKLWEFYRDQKQYSDSGGQIIPPSSGYTESELKALDGFYNFYNVKASGTGIFKIYYNAMLRAKEGTESQKSDWGGDPSWNTKWKSIFGGAYMLKESYVDRYQSTVYLQKFNVDFRSGRNFYGQYMQSISGGLTEARSLFQSFASINRLDGAYSFLIPVYKDMPAEPCRDPANGSCTLFAQASSRYTNRTDLTSPARLGSTTSPIYTEQELYEHEEMLLIGTVKHSYGIEKLEYAWDFGEWNTVSTNHQFNFSVSADFSADSTHILLIRGQARYDHDIADRKQNAYVLCAVIYVKVVTPPQVSLTYRVGNAEETRQLSAGTSVTLPTSSADSFAGWIGSDGSFLPSGASFSIGSDLTYTALFLDLKMLDGAALSTTEENPHLCFSAILDERSYNALCTLPQSAYSFIGSIQKDGTDEPLQKPPHLISTVQTSSGSFVKMNVDTEPLYTTDYRTAYSASLAVTLSYTNGTQKTVTAKDADLVRTAEAVAKSALADPTAPYSAQTIEFLKTVANAT